MQKVLVTGDNHIAGEVAKMLDARTIEVERIHPAEILERQKIDASKIALGRVFGKHFDPLSRLNIRGRPLRLRRDPELSKELLSAADAKRERRRQRNIKLAAKEQNHE